jgi:hypothetical protein
VTHEAPLSPAPSLPHANPFAELHRVSWDEVGVFADLIAAFYEREGRDPIRVEYTFILIVVRLMTLEGAWRLH